MEQVHIPGQVNVGGLLDMDPATTTTVFIGDLDLNVTSRMLYAMLSRVGPVVALRVCGHPLNTRGVGYAYASYVYAADAKSAVNSLHLTPINGKSIKVRYSHRDPMLARSWAGHIFFKNLEQGIDEKALYETVCVFGTILSCKVVRDSSGQPNGFAFVQYDTEESAQNAVDQLNGMLFNDQQVFVGRFQPNQEGEIVSENTKFTNVYVKNLSEGTTDFDLRNIFEDFGPTTSAVVMRDEDGKSKCFGFVNFMHADAAAKAVEALNGKTFSDKEWYVGRFQNKAERQGKSNLYIKNLHDSIDEEELNKMFSPYGLITSCKMTRDSNRGNSLGVAFVAFSTPEEANKALSEMNGKMVVNKPIYVSHAQSKEERRAMLTAEFAKIRPPQIETYVPPPTRPMHPPVSLVFGDQELYGQAPPGVLPQPGFGYQPQLVPGMSPCMIPMPTFMMPGYQGQQPPLMMPVYRGQQRPPLMMPVYRGQQPPPMMQQQMPPRANVDAAPIGNPTVSQDTPTTCTAALAGALVNASPEQRRTILGEKLYPLVQQLEPQAAAKVTGMFLELDQKTVLRLIESPEALTLGVNEAMRVLKRSA